MSLDDDKGACLHRHPGSEGHSLVNLHSGQQGILGPGRKAVRAMSSGEGGRLMAAELGFCRRKAVGVFVLGGGM